MRRFKAKQKVEESKMSHKKLEPVTEHRVSCGKVETWTQRPLSQRGYGLLPLRNEAPARESSWSFRKSNQRVKGNPGKDSWLKRAQVMLIG